MARMLSTSSHNAWVNLLTSWGAACALVLAATASAAAPASSRPTPVPGPAAAAPSAPSTVLAPAPARAPASQADTMAQRLLACTACHGPEGRATASGYQPRIAGKPAGYLFQQLRHFRDGRRSHAAMATLLAPLPDAYLREISEHFASQDLPYPAPGQRPPPPGEARRAEALVKNGDPARKLPACAACHGALLTGMQPAVPGLLGLPRDYLIGQIGAWRTGLRHATEPDCMAGISRSLTPDDIGALASWLSAQAVPVPAHPAPAPTRPLPQDCGSVRP